MRPTDCVHNIIKWVRLGHVCVCVCADGHNCNIMYADHDCS